MKIAYKEHCQVLDSPDTFDDWKDQMIKQHPQFMYWNTVIELQNILCQFVKSLRTANFELYIESLQMMMPWVFALDHGHYARWLPVHIHDILKFRDSHPDIAASFENGKFVVQVSNRRFSAIGIDQNHKQLNKAIKGDVFAIEL